MTTALPLSVPATQIPHTHVRRQDLSQLVAGLPRVLGAVPVDSLVLYTFGRSPDLHLATTLVGALPPPTAVDSLAARALAAARLTNAVAVIAVVVGGVAESPQPGPLPYRTLVEALRRMFDEAGIVLVHASWVRRATPGEPWRCYDDLDCHDTVPDQVSATLAAAASVAGVSQFSTRDDLARLLVPDDQTELDRRSRLFDAHLKRPSTPYGGEQLAMDLQLIMETIELAAQSAQPPTFSDAQLVRLAHALAHEEVRDDCLAIALSPDADAAERVWLSLVRALPAPERAEAAFLLAISTYLRGEVVVAALAMEAALDANPGHPMASVLRANLCAGTPPTRLRAMLIEAVIRATEQRATLAMFDPDDPEDSPPWVTDAPPTRRTDPDGETPTTEPRPADSVSDLLMMGLHPSEPAVPPPASMPEFPDIAGWLPPLTSLTSPPSTEDEEAPPPVLPRRGKPSPKPPLLPREEPRETPAPPPEPKPATELPDDTALLPLQAPDAPQMFAFAATVHAPQGLG